jgi:hypothetical protein
MKYRSPQQKDIIKELNDEVERDLITPILAIPVILLVSILVIVFVLRHAEAIDKFAQKHWALLGWSLLIGGLFGIVRWTKNRML